MLVERVRLRSTWPPAETMTSQRNNIKVGTPFFWGGGVPNLSFGVVLGPCVPEVLSFGVGLGPCVPEVLRFGIGLGPCVPQVLRFGVGLGSHGVPLVIRCWANADLLSLFLQEKKLCIMLIF
jgi:hypothetical protein